MVIDELKSTISGPESPVAFFYFDYRDQDRQTPNSFLSSILRQIVATIPETPQCVVNAHDKAYGVCESLPLHELEKMIYDILPSIHRLYVIIDALDECDESRHRRTVLQLLYRIKQIANIRLFLTSRQYPHDIKAMFHIHSQIAIYAHEFDLRRYMHQQLHHADVSDIVDGAFASKVVETLVHRAEGM